MRLKCIKDYISIVSNKKIGLTIGTYYQITDIDKFGYRIIDDNVRNFWYIKECFEPIEETRDKLINELLNTSN